MTDVNSVSAEDYGRWFDLTTEAIAVRTHLDLFTWLRGGVQYFLPHDILVAAWGDFGRGELRYDIVSAIPDIRTDKADGAALASCMQRLFAHWCAADRQPFMAPPERMNGVLCTHPLRDPLRKASPPLRTAMVHGLKDQRGGEHGLYVVLSRYAMPDRRGQGAIHMLLPCIDAAMRQVPLLPSATTSHSVSHASGNGAIVRPGVQHTTSFSSETPSGDGGMTGREMQIMQWVEMGKTNQEIGTILDISAFTVKNHLQRIFRKLDVYNRAQAVSRFKDNYAHG